MKKSEKGFYDSLGRERVVSLRSHRLKYTYYTVARYTLWHSVEEQTEDEGIYNTNGIQYSQLKIHITIAFLLMSLIYCTKT